MSTKVRCIQLLFLAIVAPMHTLWSMQFSRPQKAVLTAAALYGAGSLYDQVQGKKLQFVDVSTPSKLRLLADNHDSALINTLTRSITKLQLDQDLYLTHGPVALTKRGMSQEYLDRADAVLFSHFWVFLPTMRKKLVGLVAQLSCDEEEQREQGNITLVHGTNHGASILLRTIFDEVLEQGVPHEHFVKLRSADDAQELIKYRDVHAFYDEHIPHAPRKPVIIRANSGARAQVGEYVQFDKGSAQKHILATNFGFFGQNWWLRDGYKQSSAEFVTRPCSWAYTALNLLAPLFGGELAYIGAAIDLIKNPGEITSLPAVIDRNLKGFPRINLCEDSFKEHGIAELYPKYRDELQQIELMAGHGLVHLFIKEESAQKWCYIAKALGIRADESSRGITDIEDPQSPDVLYLHYNQARVLLHPELCNPRNMRMRFYLLADPTHIQKSIDRLYAIAHEVKAYKDAKQNIAEHND